MQEHRKSKERTERTTLKKGKQYNTDSVIKSPSDTMIYAPALAKSPVRNEKDQIIEQISNFVDEMRIQHDISEARDKQPMEDIDPRDEAHSRADEILLSAEKFKANIEKPTSNNPQLTDDQFFHLLCHVDTNLVSKIEKGEYVDLERLLPNDRLGKTGEESRLEFRHVHRSMYLAPVSASREKKITHIVPCVCIHLLLC